MISLLTANDIDAWKEIRLESLKNAPTAFIQTYESELAKTHEQQVAQLTKNDIFVWRDAENIIAGVIGFFIPPAKRLQHQGGVFATYVCEQYRGQGIGDRLMEAVIAHAEPRVVQLTLGVETNNHAALALYKRHGFVIYGTHPRAVCVDGVFYDDHLMVKML